MPHIATLRRILTEKHIQELNEILTHWAICSNGRDAIERIFIEYHRQRVAPIETVGVWVFLSEQQFEEIFSYLQAQNEKTWSKQENLMFRGDPRKPEGIYETIRTVLFANPVV